MEETKKVVDDYSFGFSNKIDRLIKDVTYRFKHYTQVNNEI